MAITTKAALAAELKISKARVSQYVKAGLPVRSDGKLNREQALNWINRTQASQTFEDKGALRARRLTSGQPSLRPAPTRHHPEEQGFDPRWPDAYEINAGKCQDFPSGCVVMGVMSMVYRAPAIAAIFAVEAGADPEFAYRLKQYVTLAMMMEAQETMERLGVRPFYDGEELLWPSEHFLECDWPHLASKAGVPCDVEGWHAAMIEKNKAEAKSSA
ncbi:hypothetical protein [Methylobacterium sp. J-076]|uniref:hypothetical protein n=1 Tax=Methylobacterium sp. J-076 TaxID=2836655 RepID=UPI001FBB8D07|nr:hypothetical protein [Methylobacterium sp. J-076]MCJ2011541.1 hypothetical protein [Methylobacterium sp. J-076]